MIDTAAGRVDRRARGAHRRRSRDARAAVGDGVARADREGPVWMKAGGRARRSRSPLYARAGARGARAVLTPIAVDVERAWLLLPDGGPSLGEREAGVDASSPRSSGTGGCSASSSRHVEEMLALGVPDMRPAGDAERFHEALAAAGGTAEVGGDGAGGRRVVRAAGGLAAAARASTTTTSIRGTCSTARATTTGATP